MPRRSKENMIFAASIVLLCFALLVAHFWNGLFAEESVLKGPSLSRWIAVGLAAPAFAWLLLNCGVLPRLPPLMPSIAVAQSQGANWAWLFLNDPAPGLLVIGSYWAAVSLVQLMVVVAGHAEPRSEFAIVAGLVTVVSGPLGWWLGWSGGVAWAGLGLVVWLAPVTHCTAGLAFRRQHKPFYARAVARLKLGKYEEAEREVIQELEKAEQDFEGWMMLADMYANQFGDLEEADRTVRAVCDQPNVTPLQISLAFHRLADWRLKLGNDPAGAARALEEICRRLPGSHFARMAALRRQQLPSSRQEWLEQQTPRKIRLPSLAGDLDADDPPPQSRMARADALQLVNECVERLKRNPNEAPVREKLATLLTEQLGKPELGLEQLDLLLGMPNQAEAKRAEWLSRQAAWHFRFRKDRAGTKQILERLVREYPQSVQAFAAQRWLNLLAMEEWSRPVARS